MSYGYYIILKRARYECSVAFLAVTEQNVPMAAATSGFKLRLKAPLIIPSTAGSSEASARFPFISSSTFSLDDVEKTILKISEPLDTDHLFLLLFPGYGKE
jgi:hypothetical protein